MKRILTWAAAIIVGAAALIYIAATNHHSVLIWGHNQQDEVSTVSLEATLDKPFLDADMIPVTLQGKEIYCFYADRDYKKAVDANAAIIDKKIVRVTLLPALTWTGWKYQIISTQAMSKEDYNNPCYVGSPFYSAERCDSISRADSLAAIKKAKPQTHFPNGGCPCHVTIIERTAPCPIDNCGPNFYPLAPIGQDGAVNISNSRNVLVIKGGSNTFLLSGDLTKQLQRMDLPKDSTPKVTM